MHAIPFCLQAGNYAMRFPKPAWGNASMMLSSPLPSSRVAPPRLLLIYPATHKLGWVRYFQLPSHSLQQVAAVTPPPWEVTLFDETHEEIPFGRDFDLVGITAMTHQATRAYEIADRFREE